MQTIGVAIAIPEPYGSELRRLRASFGDGQANAIPSHVTLLPPTTIAAAELPEVEEHLAEVAKRNCGFVIRLRGTATFRPVSPVVFVALAEGISSCELLANDVRSGRLAQELHYPYHPHVTVAQHLDDAALDTAFTALSGYECVFDVGAFQLFIHGKDAMWRTHQEFGLAERIPELETQGPEAGSGGPVD
ncbi:MAG: 2'-5' RNA ligase family protein [Propionibacteriales bacterium]|nr:2'-5' RNA ligase family protein [Propionibacteriales bacterium]